MFLSSRMRKKAKRALWGPPTDPAGGSRRSQTHSRLEGKPLPRLAPHRVCSASRMSFIIFTSLLLLIYCCNVAVRMLLLGRPHYADNLGLDPFS
jgi:hypothetical protein